MAQTRITLRAEAAQMRNGALVLRGDPFKASPTEAADLVAMGFASVVDHSVDEEYEAPTPPIDNKALSTEESSEAEGKPALKPKPTLRYRRRDLRADE